MRKPKLNIKKNLPKIKRRSGDIPGSVVYTGNKGVDKVYVHHLKYNNEDFSDVTLDAENRSTFEPSETHIVDWYDIRGLNDTQLIETLGDTFNIHPLIQESIVDVQQRPKFEEYDNAIFISIQALSFDTETLKVSKEHVTIFFRDGLLLSFQETASDIFESVRQRISSGRGRIRQRGDDYLAFALLDSIIDNYYVVLDDFEEVIERLEDNVMSQQDIREKSRIHALKKELLILRKTIVPLREAISRFSKSESTLIEESTQPFIRNLYEHTIHVMDTTESYRDMLNSLQDLFMTEVSFKMNQVMQLLTLISVIFIPLTFLAGIYGMNFDNIPELHNPNGYYILLGVMFVIFIGLLYFFKRKKWM